MTDLIAGQVQVMFDVTPTAMPQIKGGKTRALGVTTVERLPSLPDVPTIDSSSRATRRPPGSASARRRARRRDHRDAQQADQCGGRRPTIKKRLADLGATAVPPNTPAEFAKFIAENIAKWAKVIKFAGIKPE